MSKALSLHSIPPIYSPSLILTHGSGDYVFDITGKKYLDFTGGIAVHSFGHGWNVIGPAVHKQITKLVHCSGYFTTPSQIECSKKLVDFTNKACATNHFASTYLCNSGTEANEAALKFARLAAKSITSNTKKTKIISFTNAFHGRTMGALSVTAKEKYKKKFEPLIPDCLLLPFNDSQALINAASHECAAIIIEPIQGEGGLDIITSEFANTIMGLAKKFGIFIIADEVQSGLYRTGSALACAHFGLYPDMVTLAKSLAGGLPFGACVISENIHKLLSPGDHGSTIGGNPVCCEAALAVLKKLQSPITQLERQISAKYLYNKTHKLVSYLQKKFPDADATILGQGHLLGISLNEKYSNTAILNTARENGLLILLTGTNSIRFAPSFTCSAYTIKKALQILQTAIITELKK